jgi:2-succinyl-6-hydroxy-2,4-cyclohexadiene-1-carboxylate synthase
MLKSCLLWAIPGFLGLPTDWSSLSIDHLRALGLFDFPWSNFNEWAQQLNAKVKKHSSPALLMGYSLGGRLALHTLIQNPSLWKAAIIISAHTGLNQTALKQERLLQDEKWAQSFETDSWEKVIEKWNRQGVFSQDTFQFNRQEKDYQRTQVANLLKNASLGRQEDLRESIQKLPMPLLWVTGEKDSYYCKMAHGLTFQNPLSTCVYLPQAGHRVPWEQPIAFKQILEAFIQKV